MKSNENNIEGFFISLFLVLLLIFAGGVVYSFGEWIGLFAYIFGFGIVVIFFKILDIIYPEKEVKNGGERKGKNRGIPTRRDSNSNRNSISKSKR
jgi:hypothetical protein